MIKIIDYDRLPQKYDRAIYINKKTKEYSLTRIFGQCMRNALYRIFLIKQIQIICKKGMEKTTNLKIH